jgi:hypothetical protein
MALYIVSLSDGLIYYLLHASNLLCCSSQCWVSLEYSISLNGKVLAALTSEASQLITLLGTDDLCCNIYKYSKISYLAMDDLEIPINQQIDKERHYISLLH